MNAFSTSPRSPVCDGSHERVAVLRDAFVDRLADLEAPARVDRVVAERPVRRLLGRRRDPADLAVPDVEELGVTCLVEHERREEHHPVEAPERVGGRQHRQELVGHRLLARLDPDGDRQDPVALLLRHALPVGSVRGVVEGLRIPELAGGLLVLAVDRPGHHAPGSSRNLASAELSVVAAMVPPSVRRRTRL